MKKTGKFFVSMASLGLLFNNVAYAATETQEKSGGFSPKTIFIGVAGLIIVLLLYLGYKMDTKGREKPSRVSQKSEKARQKLAEKVEEIKQNSGNYEDDEGVTYEEDKGALNNDDFNETVEYNEDEDSLYEVSNEKEPSIYDQPEDNSYEEEPINSVEPEPEEEGEEFDVSVIDNLDDEEPAEPVETKKVSDETILFDSKDLEDNGFESGIEIGSNDNLEDNLNDNLEDNSLENNLENEIDSLDNIDEDLEANLKAESEKDSFIDELKNFEEPESDFAGFSSAATSPKKEDEKEPEPRKYTRVKKTEEPSELDNDLISGETVDIEEPTFSETEDIAPDNEFLSQLEANLQKNKADREAKNAKSSKSTTTKKTTRKKKED